MSPRPFRGAPLLATACLALALDACARHAADDEMSAGAAPVVPVHLGRVESRTLRDEVVAPGRWRTAQELVVAAPFGAYVESLAVEPGDVVAPGRVLGLLVTRESRAAVLGAEQLVATAVDAAERADGERALRQARRDLVRVPLVASAGGTVIRRTSARGAEVPEGAELLALAPRQSLVFEAHVPSRDAARVVPGLAATIVMEGGHGVAARVARRLPQADPGDQSALVWLVADAAPPGAIDRFGAARIAVGAARRALAVPDSAIVEDDLTGVTRIACVDRGGVATWTVVRPGAGGDGWRELLPPAPPAGTAVVVSGQRGLPDSSRVRADR